MYISSKRTIDGYTLSFNVFTVDSPERICRNIEITKNNQTVNIKYPYIATENLFDQNSSFFEEVMANHLILLESHAIHALSFAQLTGL